MLRHQQDALAEELAEEEDAKRKVEEDAKEEKQKNVKEEEL